MLVFFPIKHEKKSPKKNLRRNLIDLLVFRGKVQKISHKKSCAKAINLYFVFSSGLFGGIVTGKSRPSEGHQRWMEYSKLVDSKYEYDPELSYKQKLIKIQCLPLASIIKALGRF